LLFATVITIFVNEKLLAICTTCRKKHKSAIEGGINWAMSPREKEEQTQVCQKTLYGVDEQIIMWLFYIYSAL
jgi:hypothetical protein